MCDLVEGVLKYGGGIDIFILSMWSPPIGSLLEVGKRTFFFFGEIIVGPHHFIPPSSIFLFVLVRYFCLVVSIRISVRLIKIVGSQRGCSPGMYSVLFGSNPHNRVWVRLFHPWVSVHLFFLSGDPPLARPCAVGCGVPFLPLPFAVPPWCRFPWGPSPDSFFRGCSFCCHFWCGGCPPQLSFLGTHQTAISALYSPLP